MWLGFPLVMCDLGRGHSSERSWFGCRIVALITAARMLHRHVVAVVGPPCVYDVNIITVVHHVCSRSPYRPWT